MERACAVAPAQLRAYVASLVRCLRWDSTDALAAADRDAKRDFIDALTEISALPADSLDMEVRRLLVTSGDDSGDDSGDGRGDGDGAHLARVVAALRCRDVLLKCKAANAIGSLCTSRVAGQLLLDRHGTALLDSLTKMATCKNRWAQADAFFVLGWIVVIADESALQRAARLVASAIRLLHRSLGGDDGGETVSTIARSSADEATDATETADALSTTTPSTTTLVEQESNLRIYCLVFLLNFSQRDPRVLQPALSALLRALHALLVRLLEDAAALGNPHGAAALFFDSSEGVELLRLAVTLLGALLADPLAPSAVRTMLELRMLPELLKLARALHDSAPIASVLGQHETRELRARVQLVADSVLARR